MEVATENIRRKWYFAVAEERWSWSRTDLSKGKGVNKKPTDVVPFPWENVTAVVSEEAPIVVVEVSVAPLSEVDAAALSVSILPVYVSVGAGSRRSVAGGGIRKEEDVEGVEAGQGPVSQFIASSANAVCEHDPNELGKDVMAKVDEMMKKEKTENLSLNGELVAEKAAHADELMGNVQFQRRRKKAVERIVKDARLLAPKMVRQDSTVVNGLLMEAVLTATITPAVEIGVLTTSLKQAVKQTSELKKQERSCHAGIGRSLRG